MKRRGWGPEVSDELVSQYAGRAWDGRFVDWCRRNGVSPLAVILASARRKMRGSAS